MDTPSTYGLYPCAAPPSAPSSGGVWAALAPGQVGLCRRICTRCGGSGGVLGGHFLQQPAVCSKKVLSCSSVSVMLSGSSFSKNPMRLQSRFVLSLRSCSFCS